MHFIDKLYFLKIIFLRYLITYLQKNKLINNLPNIIQNAFQVVKYKFDLRKHLG